MNKTRLDKYDNSWYNPGGGSVKRLFWFYCNVVFFKSYIFPFSGLKVGLLKLFGASVGKGVVIKPGVNIKYPWHLPKLFHPPLNQTFPFCNHGCP